MEDKKEFWTQKNNYKENKINNNKYKIYNETTKKWETIKLSDFNNSYIDTPIITSNIKELKQNIDKAITEAINIQNITKENENIEINNENIEKLEKYIQEYKNKKENK